MNKIYIVFIAILSLATTSCSSWNEDESVEIKTPENAEYGQYLERLREYKNTDHQVILGWFDNATKVTSSRAQHMSDLPDSLDIAILTEPNVLLDFEISDMNELRSNKGTEVLAPIDFDELQTIFDADTATTQTFTEYITQEVNTVLTAVNEYQYNGIAIGYKGQNSSFMTDAAKTEYLSRQTAFLSAISTYLSANTDATVIFYGYPQFLDSKTVLAQCKYILINTLEASSTDDLSVATSQACVTDVPTDRFVVMVNATSSDATDNVTGYYGSERAITAASNWVTEGVSAYTKSGLAINNIQNDYYNTSKRYLYSRQAINVINPAP